MPKVTRLRKEQNIRLVQTRSESYDGLETWEIRIYAGKDADGNLKYVSRRTRGGIKDAYLVRAEMQTQLANGTYVSKKDAKVIAAAKKDEERLEAGRVITVAALLEKWLADIDKPSAAGTTYRRHDQIIHNDLIPALGKKRLDEITELDVQEYYSKARKNGRKDGKGGLSERTMLHHHRLLKQIFKQGIAWRMMTFNPCDGVKAPSPGKPEMSILTPKQLNQLLEIFSGSKYYIPVLLAAMTGMRRGEICGLHWNQVDFDNSTIAVQYSLEEVGREMALKEPKNDSSRRTIEVDEQTLGILISHKRSQDEFWAQVGEEPERRLVCADRDGTFMRPKNLSTAFRDVMAKADLPKVRFHDLRHTHASILLDARVSIIAVSSRLGHSNVTTTLDTYGHRMPHAGREAAIVFSKLLNKE